GRGRRQGRGARAHLRRPRRAARGGGPRRRLAGVYLGSIFNAIRASSASALIAAAPGTVSTHAQTMRPATPQRTAVSLRTLPTPTIAPVIVCVVETGMPRPVARKSVIAPLVSAQKPPTG